MTFITTGPSQPGILLDTPPTPERRIADLEERLRQVIGEREQAIAKASAQAADLQLRVSNAMAAVEARNAEIVRLNAITEKAEATLACGHPASLLVFSAETGEAVLCKLCDALRQLKKAEAELAEISQRQGATHHHWTEIAAMPQVWVSDRLGGTCHESIMRSFHVAEEVRRLLELGTPPTVVLQVMNLLEGRRGE